MLPLRQRILSRHSLVLNEEATAESAAEHGVWLPRQEPAKERWLTANLVVDTGGSMELWSHTAQQLTQTLRGSAAFRDVRLAHGFDATAPVSDGRQVLLVLTDLHADHWSDGSARRVLAHWARTMPVALVHVLPEHVWMRVGTVTGKVRLTSPHPVSPNTKWVVAHELLAMTPYAFAPAAGAEEITVPVLTLTPEGLGGWARFIAGQAPEYTVKALGPAAPAARHRAESGRSAPLTPRCAGYGPLCLRPPTGWPDSALRSR